MNKATLLLPGMQMYLFLFFSWQRVFRALLFLSSYTCLSTD